MSKWLIITICMVIVTVGLVFGALVYFLKKNQVEEDASDEIFLRSKTALLNNAVTEQLKSGIVAVEGGKVAASARATRQTVLQANSALSAALASKRQQIDDLKKEYARELSKIK